MQRRDLETAAASYSYLRGLLFIPLGGLFILAALGNWEVGPLRHTWAFLVVAAALGLVYLLINRYYVENYGRLTPSTRQQVRAGAAVAVAVAVVLGGSLLLRSRADWSLDLPVNAVAVTFALVMLISYGVGVGLKAHHLIIWGALLVTGALPVWDGADPSNIGLVLAGAAVMISGVFDHRVFVDTFGPPKALQCEDGDVAA
jgi:hypothetical protein